MQIDKQLGYTETLHRNHDPRKVDQKFTEIRSQFLREIAKFKVKMKGWFNIGPNESEWKSPISCLVKFNFLTLNVNMQKYQGFVYFKKTWKKECSKERRGEERRGRKKTCYE